MSAKLVTLTLLLTVDFALAGSGIYRGPCLRTGMFQKQVKDRALTGYIQTIHMVRDETECGRKCVGHYGCVSYNYQYKVEHGEHHTCELNSQTKEIKPEAFKSKPGFQYFGTMENLQKPIGCEKYRCYNGGTCIDTCHGDLFVCLCTTMFRGKQCERPKARNCQELLQLGITSDGVYRIAPDNKDNGISVYCDQTTDGGGWIVFQKRLSPFSHLFEKNWTEYEMGFGIAPGEFWLGNRHLARLTANPVQLRVDLTEQSAGNKGFAHYENFSISGAEDNYRLSVGRFLAGAIGNALHGDSNPAFNENGMQFTTADRDNDANSLGNCAAIKGHGLSGWWLSNCGRANLNKVAMPQWLEWRYESGINETEMKLR